MGISIEELAADVAERISSDPSFYVGLILYNSSSYIDMMNKIYYSFRKKMNQNSTEFSFLRVVNKNCDARVIFRRKEQDPCKIFVFYDSDSHIYNTKKELVARCFAINVGECMKPSKNRV